MLLTITNEQAEAVDLSFLLHKHPDREQSFTTSYGRARVFYPEVSEQRCTVALVMEVDPIGLVRRPDRDGGHGFSLYPYVNDRPYVVSSFMSVALNKVFRSALAGDCKHRPELVSKTLSLEVALPVLPCRGGERLLRGLFEPLGYEVTASRLPLDEAFPAWGESVYYQVTLRRRCPLKTMLSQLYVLFPVLDEDKHYWVSEDEVAKLLRQGEGWLADHPLRDSIARRYLRHQKSLMTQAIDELSDDTDPSSVPVTVLDAQEEVVETPLRLNELRYEAVIDAVSSLSPRSVVDLGCGEGKLLKRLLRVKGIETVLGLDVSVRALEVAAKRLRLDSLPERVREKITLVPGSLMYRDRRIAGYDVACVVEVIEHLDPVRLAAFERVVFEFTRPKRVIVTTPNREYNVKFDSLPAGTFRHRDHRFEWTRSEFEGWARDLAERFGYQVGFHPIGMVDEALGGPTQMGVFDENN